MLGVVERVALRFGYRGLALLLFGLIWCLIGLSVYLNPEPIAGLIHTSFPLWLRLITWFGSGLLAVAAAVCTFLKVAVRRTQMAAFALLMVDPMLRAISFGWAMIHEASLNRLSGLVVWGLLLLLVLLISAWPEPPPKAAVAVAEMAQ